MLIISTPNNKRIPYHDKVINTVVKKISEIDPNLLKFNWFLSGSFAVNCLYSPKQSFNDIDFYFTNQQDFEDCYNYLLSNTDNGSFVTENAITFNNLNIQLINKWFYSPEKLIYTHDFVNVSVAITKENIYTTKETTYSWYNEQLSLRNFQISNNPPATDYDKVAALIILNSRVRKYLDRYQFVLSNSFKKFYYDQLEFLKSLDIDTFASNQPPIYNYYGQLIDYSSSISRALYEIEDLLNPSPTTNTWNTEVVF